MTPMVPVDAQALAIAYLAEKMPTYDVSSRVGDRDGQITVEQVGGARRSPVHDYPMLVIQAWHSSDIEAGDMCREAFAHLDAIGDDPVWGYRVRGCTIVGGPHAFPDPESRSPRWQVTVELNVRPVPLP